MNNAQKLSRFNTDDIFFLLMTNRRIPAHCIPENKYIMRIFQKKTCEISDLTPKYQLFSMICLSSPIHKQRLKFCMTTLQ